MTVMHDIHVKTKKRTGDIVANKIIDGKQKHGRCH